ncbi:MAG: ABC transporter ATP-binding protein [Candidatus Riflebacteria bacterium]|nr:ABC transporter ATP-binding protein [Candidatus Riflebacteria bacterium]
MIELRSLGATAGRFRLDGVSFTIGAGDCHVIVGPTGAGKTFLLETIVGLRQPDTGTILIDGADVAGVPPNGRGVSYVPQDTCLFPTLTVRQNIRYGIDIRGTGGPDAEKLIGHLVEFLRIGDLLDRYPRHLSGGERQRVALARALAPRPALLALDEPFSAIDHSLREEIRRMIKSLLEEFRTTTLIVTHDLDEAFFLGSTVSLLMDGRIIQSGPREEMYYHPKTLPAATFLGIKNLFPGRVEALGQEEITVTSAELGLTITVPCRCARKRFAPQQPVRFGIRSEAVYVLRHHVNPDEKHCVIQTVVRKMYLRGRFHTILVETDTPTRLEVEIDIHDTAARKIGITEGARLPINLNPKHIFLLAEAS